MSTAPHGTYLTVHSIDHEGQIHDSRSWRSQGGRKAGVDGGARRRKKIRTREGGGRRGQWVRLVEGPDHATRRVDVMPKIHTMHPNNFPFFRNNTRRAGILVEEPCSMPLTVSPLMSCMQVVHTYLCSLLKTFWSCFLSSSTQCLNSLYVEWGTTQQYTLDNLWRYHAPWCITPLLHNLSLKHEKTLN